MSKNHYTDEFKQQIVNLYKSSKTPEQLCDDYQIGKSTGFDFNNISQKMINWIINVINDKLRPRLNWISAKTIFLQNFK